MAIVIQSRVKVTNQDKPGFNQAATVVRVAGGEVFIRLDGEPAAEREPYTTADLELLPPLADGRRGGGMIGRFKR